MTKAPEPKSCGHKHTGFVTPAPGGVAAPLEPPSASRLWLDKFGEAAKGNVSWEFACSFAEDYAAAVSKAKDDKYAEMEAKWMRELLTVSNEIGEEREELAAESYMNVQLRQQTEDLTRIAQAAEARITALEQEIAELRVTR